MQELGNTASMIRWTATDLGVQIKWFVYTHGEKFVLATDSEVSLKTLREMVAEVEKRLEDVDTMLPPWND